LAFEQSIATLFNKTEEGCVTRADEAWVMRCDCICSHFFAGMRQHKYEFACSRLSRESTRL